MTNKLENIKLGVPNTLSFAQSRRAAIRRNTLSQRGSDAVITATGRSFGDRGYNRMIGETVSRMTGTSYSPSLAAMTA